MTDDAEALRARVAELEHRLQLAQEREERVLEALDRAGHAYWIGQVRGGNLEYTHFSPAFGRLWSIDPRAVLADPFAWLEQLHPDDRGEIEARVRSVLPPASGRDLEFRLVRGDEVRWVQSRNVLLQPENGEPGVVAGVAVDVSEARRSHDALARNELLYRTVVQTLGEGVIIEDAAGHAIDCNDAACDILGLPRDELIGRVATDRRWQVVDEHGSPVGPDDLPSVRAHRGARRTRALLNVALGDERRVWLLVTSEPLPGGGVVKTIADVTAWKEAQLALAASEARLRLALEAAGMGTWECDLASGACTASAQHGALFDVDAASARTIDAIEARMTPASAARHREARRRAREDGDASRAFREEVEVALADGRVRHVALHGALRPDADGAALRLVGVSLDVTSTYEAARRARETAAFIGGLVDALPLLLCFCDASERLRVVNAPYAAFFGTTPEALIGKTLAEVLGPMYASVAPFHARALAGERVDFSHPGVDNDGRPGEYEVSYVPMRTDEGAVEGVLALIRDVTERRRVEAALREREQELQAARERAVRDDRLRALGQLASGVAHDFNNHLTPILGFADLLLEGGRLPQDERLRRYVEAIRTAAEGASRVVSRLREFYRGHERGDGLTLIDPREVMREAMSLSEPRWRDQACARGQTVTFRNDLRPTAAITGNPHELRDAVLNVILNAVDALGPGGGTISLRTRQEQEQVLLEVEDDGCGMTDDVRRRCFEPFFTTKGDGGTGLGLPQVWGIVERHGGVVDVDTAPGHGTRLRLRLPRGTPRAAEPGSDAHAAPVAPRKVLLVDDDAATRALLREALEVDGHEVVAVQSGDEALAHLRAGGLADVMITDRSMPRMNGDVLAGEVRALAPRLPILMVTGFGEFMTDEERPAAVDRVLAKPVSLAALRKALRRLPSRG